MNKILKRTLIIITFILIVFVVFIFRFSLSTFPKVAKIKIIDSDISVKSFYGNEGWRAIKAEIQKDKNQIIMIVNLAKRDNDGKLQALNLEENKKYTVALAVDHQLSLRCQNQVFKITEIKEK